MVENFAPGVMKRMGFSYEDLKRVNPKIIMCSISMAGQTGPLSSRAGYDPIGQSYAGITDGLGEKDHAPSITTMAIGDVSTGVASAMALGFAIRLNLMVKTSHRGFARSWRRTTVVINRSLC